MRVPLFSLGLGYMHGLGVAQDQPKAAQLYQRAADLGDVNAMKNLALCYKHGQGVPQDHTREAMQLFGKVAQRDGARSSEKLRLNFGWV